MKERGPLDDLPEGVTTVGEALRKAFEGFSWFPNELIPVLCAPYCGEAIRASLDSLMRRHEAGELENKEIQVSVIFFGTITGESTNEASRRHFISWVSDNNWRGRTEEQGRFAQLYIPLKRLADSLQNHKELFE